MFTHCEPAPVTRRLPLETDESKALLICPPPLNSRVPPVTVTARVKVLTPVRLVVPAPNLPRAPTPVIGSAKSTTPV